MVQLRLRKTHNFVGARSSCSMGGPRNVSISVSLRPISRSTPCVPTCTASPGGALVASVGGATTLRTGAGRGGGSGAGIVSAALAWSELLGRNSAGGESTHPPMSITPTTPMRCRPLQPFIPLPPLAPSGLDGRRTHAWHLRHRAASPSVSPSPPLMAPGWACGPTAGFCRDGLVPDFAMRIWPK